MTISTENMTAAQLIKTEIIIGAAIYPKLDIPEITSLNIDDIFDELQEEDVWSDYIQDARNGLRDAGEDCNLRCTESSRHYDCEQVAYKCVNGEWVSWVYWFGGGKFGEPESIDWMDDAYLLDVVETEKVIIHREFSKKQ